MSDLLKRLSVSKLLMGAGWTTRNGIFVEIELVLRKNKIRSDFFNSKALSIL